jgi:hypothetical protein
MKLDKVQVGKWYRTRVGIGQVLDNKNFRGVVKMQIVYPFPRGLAMLKPREIEAEVDAPVEGAKEPPANWRD